MTPPLVIALEGPSYSGKSTLGARLVSTLPGEGCLLPCYVDVAGGDAQVPEPRGATPEGQLASLWAFAGLDRRRSAEATDCLAGADWVVADRCWLSLLAHVHAIADTGGPNVYATARALLAAEDGLLQPSIVLYLAVSEERRAERVPPGRDQQWNALPSFNESLARFYAEEAPGLLAVPLQVLDGNAPPEDVHAQAAAVIAAYAADRGAMP